MTYLVLLCCRMASTRLPGKTLAVYTQDGTTNLEQIIRRWQASRRTPQVVVCVNEAETAQITRICEGRGVPVVYRPGSVLECMEMAVKRHSPHVAHIARALGDNPLVDVTLADWRLDVLRYSGADGLWYGGDDHSQITYAATTDVWSRAGWDKIVSESRGEELEHPGLYYWRNIDKFSAATLSVPPAEYLYPIRTELDDERDLAVFRAVHGAWEQCRPEWLRGSLVPTLWALEWLHTHPEIAAINAEVQIKTQTRAEHARGTAWVCSNCDTPGGRIVNGNLIMKCNKCGGLRKFYAHRPAR